MVELFNRVRESVISEARAAYNKLNDEERNLYHKALGLYETHPGASFFAGVIVALVAVWVF